MLAVLVVLTILLPLASSGPNIVGPTGAPPVSAQSVPGWMTPEQAARFTNDWPALVPSWVPEPFASVIPTISVTATSYQLYWLVLGGPPTFLVVSANTSGYIPAGSSYDLNVELVVNATVRGNPAYHDPTPIYDAVHWREGGISYTANGQGLSTDIVSYANAFTTVTAPAPVPTATVAAPVSLFSPDVVASGSIATVTSRGGGTGASLSADGGVFADTGTATYPGAGDAAVTWVAPDVAVDTYVTFSLRDASGAVLVTTPTLVTAAAPPVRFALDCAPTVAAGDTLAVAITGAGNVMLGGSDGYWPQRSPNTDYDPGTDGGTLAFSLGGGGTATLIWAAPPVPGFVTLTASGSSGMVLASCGIEVLGEEASATATSAVEATLPIATATPPPVEPTVPATIPASAATVPISPTATVMEPTPTRAPAGPAATATVPGTNPGDGTDTGFGSAPTAAAGEPTASATGPGPQPTVPGTNPGDGIDAGQGSVPPSPTARSGDGTDFSGVATVPPSATYPAIPTSAPLPDAPPTSVPPTDGSTEGAGQGPSTVPTSTPGASAMTPTSGPRATATTALASTATVVRSTAVAATRTPTASADTALARPTVTPTAQATIAGPTEPAAIVTAPTRTTTATTTPTVVAPAATTVPATATAPAATATELPASPVPATATVVPPTATATLIPPPATATTRPPATSTATPVRPGQASTSLDASPTLPSAAAGSVVTPSVAAATPTAPAPTPTSPVPTLEAVAREIGPAGGTVEHPAGGRLDVAEGTFGSTMTVSMAQLPDTDLPVSPDVELIPSTGYEIEIRSVDGVAMTALPTGVTLNLAVPEAQRSEAVVYWIDGGRLTRLRDASADEAGVSVPLAHLSRYVAGIPVTEIPELNWLPWVVAIAAAISGLMVVGLLAQNARGHRRRDARRPAR